MHPTSSGATSQPPHVAFQHGTPNARPPNPPPATDGSRLPLNKFATREHDRHLLLRARTSRCLLVAAVCDPSSPRRRPRRLLGLPLRISLASALRGFLGLKISFSGGCRPSRLLPSPLCSLLPFRLIRSLFLPELSTASANVCALLGVRG
eukprot:1289300-Prymnesium_polylepis.1